MWSLFPGGTHTAVKECEIKRERHAGVLSQQAVKARRQSPLLEIIQQLPT